MVVEDGRWKNWIYEPWMREAAGISALHSHPILLSRAFFRVLFFASTQNSAKKRDRESTLNQTLYTKHSYLNHFSPFEFVFQSSHFNNFQSLKFRERERYFGNGWHHSGYGDRSARWFSGGTDARRSVSSVQHLWEPLRGHGKVPPSYYADRSRRIRNCLVLPQILSLLLLFALMAWFDWICGG